jgi:endo-1,4-beta-xylanase
MRVKRRMMATAAIVAGVLTAGTPAMAAGTTLKAAAEAQGRYFGTEVTGNIVNNSTITNLAGQQFDMVTPGNEMKWDTTEPSNGG